MLKVLFYYYSNFFMIILSSSLPVAGLNLDDISDTHAYVYKESTNFKSLESDVCTITFV